MTLNKQALLNTDKHANQHRLSRLTMEVHSDELRIIASAVESYTDELIAALEAVEKRIAELEARTVTVKLPADYRNDDGSINSDMFNTCAVVVAFREGLSAAGIKIKGE